MKVLHDIHQPLLNDAGNFEDVRFSSARSLNEKKRARPVGIANVAKRLRLVRPKRRHVPNGGGCLVVSLGEQNVEGSGGVGGIIATRERGSCASGGTVRRQVGGHRAASGHAWEKNATAGELRDGRGDGGGGVVLMLFFIFLGWFWPSANLHLVLTYSCCSRL